MPTTQGRLQRSAARWALVGAWLVVASVGCAEPEESEPASAPTATAVAMTPPREVDETIVPRRRPTNPNPLELPPAATALAAGAFVYAVPEPMLAAAKLGTSLELRAARVEGMDGADVVVRMGTGPAYSIHPGYVVVPRLDRVARGTRVIVPHRERLRHGVVDRQVQKRIVVRYGDVGIALGEQSILAEEVGVLRGGLEPGAYALAKDDRGPLLVLLVSASSGGNGAERWLVFGEEGTARLVPSSELSPIPDVRKQKPGSPVRVAWHGRMVPATLRSVEPTGLIVVKRARVGPALVVGPDMVMPDVVSAR